MRLTRININGFKSFADNTTIEINEGITTIVGPNGSGKSNIVDAVKWALGDQSVKDIRGGEKMADLIFTGSSSRKSKNRAWVSLTFDNSDFYLKTEYKEVEVKRIIYKSGDNEYYINNERVRLKDILNLFIDSGTTVNSLSIISQGKVNEIINSKAEERRFILEESAGVLKYKKRKAESLRKLEKTDDNLKTINLLIDEISVNLKPLKKQSEEALNYKSIKESLKNLEVSLYTTKIKKLHDLNTNLKEDLTTLESDATNLIKRKNNNELIINKLLLNKYNLEEDLNSLSVKIDNMKGSIRTLESEKQIMIERQKYSVNSSLLDQNAIILKEKLLEVKNEIEKEEHDLEILRAEIIKNNQYIKTNDDDLSYKNEELNKIIVNNNNLNVQINQLETKITSLNDELSRLNKAPYHLRNLLKQNIKGINNILREIIKVDSYYKDAINNALGSSLNIVISDDFKSSEKGICYLKNNNLGRGTFYPVDTIKGRFIKNDDYENAKNVSGFVDIASNLVKIDSQYKNIIDNLLGNTIISKDLASGNKISKKLNYKYKIVSLKGDIINPGGSLTGGFIKNINMFTDQINNNKRKIKQLQNNINANKINEDNLSYEIDLLEKGKKDTRLANALLNERINHKNNIINNLNNTLDKINSELKGTEGLINNTIGSEIEKVVNKYYKQKEALDLLIKEELDLKNELSELTFKLNKLEDEDKKAIKTEKDHLFKINDIKLKINEAEIKMDNLLMSLNENHSMTFEYALQNYNSNIGEKEAESEIYNLKKNLGKLDEVNLGAPKEYERVKTRYDFLSAQKEDLEKSINNIMGVITDLDQVMKEKLNDTYAELNNEFTKTFKSLFGGGTASLKLVGTDILTAGLEIEAIPPGKDIKSTKILSGGELALTAIALLFSILNIRTVPYSILDEVEAALDEENVNKFGEYINKLNTKTQFILITHKKRTMEFSDTLYGITMEESGVSKVVSVKLD